LSNFDITSPDNLIQFASDNVAGACPEAREAFLGAAGGFVPSYGTDEVTRQACDAIRELFATDCEVFFVFNGTAANSLALAALCQPYQSIICADTAHIEVDECGAPAFFANGAKLICSGGSAGKLGVQGIESIVRKRQDIHHPQARAVSISQSTELGTVYTAAEIAALGECARSNRLKFHMDGARFANAVAHLGVHPADITWRAGVDVLCFGGAKLGMPLGETVVFFDRELAADFGFRCKQAGQLASKMRFLSAPWLAMLRDGTWLRHARHANAMARRLASALATHPTLHVLYPVEANAVFVQLPDDAVARLRAQGWQFLTSIGGGARFVCSWVTTEAAVDRLAQAIAGSMQAHARGCMR
jgi:threonine aldolase